VPTPDDESWPNECAEQGEHIRGIGIRPLLLLVFLALSALSGHRLSLANDTE